MRLAPGLILLLLLSGCAAPTQHPERVSLEGPDAESATSSAPALTTPPPPIAATPGLGLDVEWTACRGVGGLLDGPFEGNLPPGWQATEQPEDTIAFSVQKCDRASWGPYERGPIYTLFEFHQNFVDPAKCHEGSDVKQRMILESIWFSDPELVAWAKGFGMTAYQGTFQSNYTALPENGTALSFSWNATNRPRSDIEYATDSLRNPVSEVNRIYWFNGEGISYWDLRQDYQGDSIGKASKGTMQAPMLWGRAMPRPEFVSYHTGIGDDESMSAHLARFHDVQCEVPW